MSGIASSRRATPPLLAAQTWVEAASLIGALRPGPRDVALSVARGGDGALALAAAGAGEVHYAARDPADRALFELKLVGARALPVEGLRCLFGVDAAGRRVFLYHAMRDALSASTRTFWDANESLIREGLLRAGALERRLDRWRAMALPKLVSREGLDALRAGGERAQAARAIGVRIRLAAGALGVEDWRVGRLAARLREGAADGPLLSWALNGTWRSLDDGPAYLTRAGHAALAGARVKVVDEPVTTALERPYSCYDLGDLGEDAVVVAAAAAPLGARMTRAVWRAGAADPRWRRDEALEAGIDRWALLYERIEAAVRS